MASEIAPLSQATWTVVFSVLIPVAVPRDVPPVDGDPWHVGEGVELFGLCGVVHGWNKTGFSGKLDDSA